MSIDRFITAQKRDYNKAFNEIRQGKKESHWMWYIFPQILGLGYSDTSNYYAIRDISEAKEYMNNDYLKGNLIRICQEVLKHNCNTRKIFGEVDAIKLHACATLFWEASHEEVFIKIINKFYGAKENKKTLDILKAQE